MTTFHVMWVPGADPLRDETVEKQRSVFPELHTHEDPERKGLLQNWIKALEKANELGDHWAVILSDDAVPLEGVDKHLVEVLRYTPTPIVSLSHFGDRGTRLVKKGVPFGVADHALWGQAIAFHRSVIPGVLDVAHKVLKISETEKVYRKWDDRIPGVYNRLTGGKSAFTARALFTHAPIKSLLGHGGNVVRGPETTILDPGPWWGATPRYVEVGTPFHDLQKRLVRLLSEEAQG